MKEREQAIYNDGAINKGLEYAYWDMKDELSDDWNWVKQEESEIADEFSKDLNTATVEQHIKKTIPYIFLQIFLQWFNISQNLGPNHLWAHYNWYLMGNTAVSLVQGFLSFLLVAELPVYMRLLKPVRAFSFGLASLWNFFYLFIAIEFMHDIYQADNGLKHFGLSEFIQEMMFTFGLAMHLPIWTMNLVVIFRELYIEFSSSERYRKYIVHGKEYNFRLGWSDVIGALWRFANYFNPLWWIYRIFFYRSSVEHQDL